MGLGRVQVPDRQPQRVAAGKLGMRDENLAALIDRFEKTLVERVDFAVGHVPRTRSEAHDAEGHGCEALEMRGSVDPACEQLRESHVFGKTHTKSVRAEVT